MPYIKTHYSIMKHLYVDLKSSKIINKIG